MNQPRIEVTVHPATANAVGSAHDAAVVIAAARGIARRRYPAGSMAELLRRLVASAVAAFDDLAGDTGRQAVVVSLLTVLLQVYDGQQAHDDAAAPSPAPATPTEVRLSDEDRALIGAPPPGTAGRARAGRQARRGRPRLWPCRSVTATQRRASRRDRALTGRLPPGGRPPRPRSSTSCSFATTLEQPVQRGRRSAGQPPPADRPPQHPHRPVLPRVHRALPTISSSTTS